MGSHRRTKTTRRSRPFAAGAGAHGEATIQNCVMRYRCPRQWESLTPLPGTGSHRHCDTCRETVHLCSTDAELAAHVRQGHCVAFLRTDRRTGTRQELLGVVLDHRDREV